MSTGYIFYDPRNRPLSATSTTLPNSYRIFYYTGTTTLAPIYANPFNIGTGLPPPQLSNPLYADGFGFFPVVYLDPTVVYRTQLFDQYGNQIEDVDPGSAVTISINQSVITQALWPQTVAESNAGITPSNYDYPAYDSSWTYLSRYNGNLASAVAVAASNNFTIFIDQPTILSANVTVPQTCSLYFIGSGYISTSNGYTLTVLGPVIANNTQTNIFTGAGTNVVTATNANWFFNGNLNVSGNQVVGGNLTVTGGITGQPAIQGSFKNLVGKATGVDSHVTYTADQLVLQSSTMQFTTIGPVNINGLLASGSGINGLDTGTIAASTWYSVWAIYNPTTAAYAGLLSLSATSPTLPTGYTFYGRLGWIQTDSTANKYPLSFIQYGRDVELVVLSTGNVTGVVLIASGSSGSVGSSGPTSTATWTAFPLTTNVPTTASKIKILLRGSGSGTVITAPNPNYGGYANTSNPPLCIQTAGAELSCVMAEFAIETSSAPNIYYACSGTTGYLFQLGWSDNL